VASPIDTRGFRLQAEEEHAHDQSHQRWGHVFPGWKRNIFVGGLRQGESPRTGQIQRIEFNEKWEEIRREPVFRELQQRIRDVRQGPDGYLYALTEEEDGALLKIEPAPK
jgi:glucose/arabinose dehydrogenase